MSSNALLWPSQGTKPEERLDKYKYLRLPSQGIRSVVPSAAVEMAYEDLDIMGYEPVDWFNGSWKQRIPLTIAAGKIPTTQTDFPLLINDTYPDLVNEEEAELRFTGADDLQLDYEIQFFDNSTGELIAWVKKPTVSNGDIIRIYFDNPAAIDEQNAPAVWSDYIAVWHLDNNFLDSTGIHNAQNSGTVDVAGKIGRARFFDGTNDMLAVPLSTELNPEVFTFSAWIKLNNGSSFRSIVTSVDFGNSRGFILYVQGASDLLQIRLGTEPSFDIFNDANVLSGSFAYVTASRDATESKITRDSTPTVFAATPDFSPNTIFSFHIGAGGDIGDTFFFPGSIEEVRMCSVVRSNDFITAEFNNQTNPGTFYSTGTVESVPGGIPMEYEV